MAERMVGWDDMAVRGMDAGVEGGDGAIEGGEAEEWDGGGGADDEVGLGEIELAERAWVAPLPPMIRAIMEEDINRYSRGKRERLWKWYVRWLRYAMESLLKIRTQDAELVPLRLNRIQRKMMARVLWDWKIRGVPCRYIVGPKPRRIGATTFWTGLRHIVTKYTPHFPSLIIAHNLPTTEMVLGWHHMFEDYIAAKAKLELPGKDQWKQHPIVMPTKKRSAKNVQWYDWLGDELGFSEEGGSYVRLATGGSVKGAVGDAFRFIHYAEVGVDDVDWESVTKSNDRMCPDRDAHGRPAVGTFVVKEGSTYLDDTSRVLTGVYLQNAIEATINGQSSYTHLFYPWYEHERYRLPLEEGERVEPFGAGVDSKRKSREEIERVRGLIWRDWRIEEASGVRRERLERECEEAINYQQNVLLPELEGDWNWLYSQYPSTWQEAFVTKAQRFFDSAEVTKRIEAVVGGVEHRVESERLVVYRDREEGVRYLVVSDHASGHGDDWAGAWAFNTRDLSVDAVWHGNVSTDVQAAEIVELCNRYSEWKGGVLVSPATWVPEANTYGSECVRIARDELGFTELWRRKMIDPRTKAPGLGQFGFWTGESQRIDALERLGEQWKTWTIPDIRVLMQFASFGYKKGSFKPQAWVGGDEFVTCGWIQAYVNQLLGYAQRPDWRNYTDVPEVSGGQGVSTLDRLALELEILKKHVAQGKEGAATRYARVLEAYEEEEARVRADVLRRDWFDRAESGRSGRRKRDGGDWRLRGLGL